MPRLGIHLQKHEELGNRPSECVVICLCMLHVTYWLWMQWIIQASMSPLNIYLSLTCSVLCLSLERLIASKVFGSESKVF
jgi:hypothetical protein